MSAEPESDDELTKLLEFVRDRRGFDFTGYKRPSLTRRVQKRMQAVGVDDYEAYMSVLEADPTEFRDLFDTILINVTGFLRDPDAWEYVRTTVIPTVIARSDETGEEIRLWSAGCATGEEAYSLAVLFAEALGEERFRDAVKLYATDADNDALTQARQARYSHRALVDAFGDERVDRFFEAGDGGLAFRSDLRRSLIFGRHDLVQDPPISRVDLITCRNTLMYFNAEVQRRVLANFHFALRTGGHLFLGKAEAMATRTNLFGAADAKRHIFQKLDREPSMRPPLPAAPTLREVAARSDGQRIVEAAFEAGRDSQLVVDAEGVLVLANRIARAAFGLGTKHLGRPLRDAEVSYRPVELRSLIEAAIGERRTIAVNDVEYRSPSGELQHLDVLVQPVERGGTTLGAAVTYTDVTRFRVVSEELERSQRELEFAHEELQSAVEELETTNEELQSTNEELETTNEELHSTNEELETMNEELHSTNEELSTVNAELRSRTEALHEGNRFLAAVLGSLHAGVVVVSPDMSVRAWNRQAEELWGLRADEVDGQHFLNLDIGLPVDQLRSAIRACTSGESNQERVEVSAVNRRGRPFQCVVTVSTLDGDGGAAGAILVMEQADEGRPG